MLQAQFNSGDKLKVAIGYYKTTKIETRVNACNAKHRCNLGQLVLRREQSRAQRVVSFKPVVVGVVVAATSTSIEFNFINNKN